MIVREGQIWRIISDVKKDDNLRLVDFDIDWQVINVSKGQVLVQKLYDNSDQDSYYLQNFQDNFIYIFTPEDYKEEDKPKNKYHRDLKGVTVDVYDVLKAFEVTDPALQHLIKKALCAGLRGHKNKDQDLQDILDSAKRAVELND
jgi:hypothetical protein